MSFPIGVYERLLDEVCEEQLRGLSTVLLARLESLKPVDAIPLLVRELGSRLRSALLAALRDADEGKADSDILAVATQAFRDVPGPKIVDLRALLEVREALRKSDLPRPLIPLGESALVSNDQRLSYHQILRSELGSADRVDFICPFIGIQGLRLIIDAIEHPERVRVLTTTYLGGTHLQALELLAARGAEVRIAYESAAQKTALHAKAWIFHRSSGFPTACIGSSNLSPKALVDGLEWNLRVSGVDAPSVFDELAVTFERLWNDARFEDYEPERDRERVSGALQSQRGPEDRLALMLNVEPLPHQREMLQELVAAREAGKHRNLVVAATGTGKTLLAAFDYAAFAGRGRPSLLFIAHRQDILEQARDAFRLVLRDRTYGELLVGGSKPDRFHHVFASIQSLSRIDLDTLARSKFEFVIFDEFHHAEAPTYKRALAHLEPKELLGLTATPERTDGVDVAKWFDGATIELRLWHALERGLLSPFQYFGIDDGIDLRQVRWSLGRYHDEDLESSLIANGRARAELVVKEFSQHVRDARQARAVAFCASVRHADFMVPFFQNAGVTCRALHSQLPGDEREVIMRAFRAGEINVLCTVDLLNEGIDVPEIDTVLFLRPTESATIFLQQLGRGLRLHADKAALTVLDFVGRQHAKFRFDVRFQALTGLARGDLVKAVEEGFPTLPAGCAIQLGEVPRQSVLNSLRNAIPTSNKSLVAELRAIGHTRPNIRLTEFLQETGLQLSDIYRQGRTFRSLREEAGLVAPGPTFNIRLEGLLHVNDSMRKLGYLEALAGDGENTWHPILAYVLRDNSSLDGITFDESEEIRELLNAVDAKPKRRLAVDLPFCLHGQYSRDEIVAAFGRRPSGMRQGTFYSADHGVDLHIFTLRKSEQLFSPSTRYADYFLSERRIHWESQSTTTQRSATGQRLITGSGRHLFFVREGHYADRRTSPFLCLGFGTPVSSEGEKPIRLVWDLDFDVPDHLYPSLRAAAG